MDRKDFKIEKEFVTVLQGLLAASPATFGDACARIRREMQNGLQVSCEGAGEFPMRWDPPRTPQTWLRKKREGASPLRELHSQRGHRHPTRGGWVCDGSLGCLLPWTHLQRPTPLQAYHMLVNALLAKFGMNKPSCLRSRKNNHHVRVVKGIVMDMHVKYINKEYLP